MKPFETVEYKNYKIELHFDEDPLNPREEFDNFGTMVCSHRNYNLGDEQWDSNKIGTFLSNLLWEYNLCYADWDIQFKPKTKVLKEYMETLRLNRKLKKEQYNYDVYGSGPLYSFQDFIGDLENNDEDCIDEAWERLGNNLISLPLYLYDHSGISMKTSGFNCPWDSGQVGFIYVTKNQILENWGKKKLTKKLVERAITLLKAEVGEYDTYLTGQVYGYVVKDSEDEELDSCWGFYDDDYMVEEAKLVVDYQVREDEKEKEEERKLEAFLIAQDEEIPLTTRPNNVSQQFILIGA